MIRRVSRTFSHQPCESRSQLERVSGTIEAYNNNNTSRQHYFTTAAIPEFLRVDQLAGRIHQLLLLSVGFTRNRAFPMPQNDENEKEKKKRNASASSESRRIPTGRACIYRLSRFPRRSRLPAVPRRFQQWFAPRSVPAIGRRS